MKGIFFREHQPRINFFGSSKKGSQIEVFNPRSFNPCGSEQNPDANKDTVAGWCTGATGSRLDFWSNCHFGQLNNK